MGRVARGDLAQIKTRQLGVSFEGLSVVGLGSSASYQETLGSIFNPFHLGERLRNARHPPLKSILSGFEGVVRPGDMLCKLEHTMCLVLVSLPPSGLGQSRLRV